MKREFLTGLTVAAFVVQGAPIAGATMVLRSLSLDETTQTADRIVYAKVSNVRVGNDEAGLLATWITFDLERTLKGRPVDHVTIKQLGDCDASRTKAIGRIPDLPLYAVGEDVIVFVRRDSARGFTSPVGLGDGVIRVKGSGSDRSIQGGAHQGEAVEVLLSRIADLVAAQAKP